MGTVTSLYAYDKETGRPVLVQRVHVNPGDRFTMVMPSLTTERQPNGVHTVLSVEYGTVYWKEGGASPLYGLLSGKWKKVQDD